MSDFKWMSEGSSELSGLDHVRQLLAKGTQPPFGEKAAVHLVGFFSVRRTEVKGYCASGFLRAIPSAYAASPSTIGDTN